MTLVVRDEEEILEDTLEYHLGAGVDLVLVTDHRSEDRTPEILESYERRGLVRAFREDGRFNDQDAWQTRMARAAYVDHEADWVILGDADEFWWPRGASLKDALDQVPPRYGSVRGLQHNFVPVREGPSSFAERMIVRLAAPAPINDPATPFRPVSKIVVRGGPHVRVGQGGAHQVFDAPGAPLTAWHPVEILHFPLRSREQCARKYEKTWSGWQVNLRGDLARAHGADAPDVMWERLALGSETVRRGLDDGMLAMDVRLRDALRDVAPIEPTSSDAFEHIAACVFREAEVVRRQRWVDDLTRRVDAVDNGLAQPPRDGR